MRARGWIQISTDASSHLPFFGVEANGFVFVSGQASPTALVIVSGSFEEEMRRPMQNVIDAALGRVDVGECRRVTSHVTHPTMSRCTTSCTSSSSRGRIRRGRPSPVVCRPP
jgi:hypothetical protein